ncbi:AbrB family transcriptional regulator [Celerinatantimonas sp. MCCC 1A17872]|uniref:AbrB family transcriptional regulator n=1 Tax=Celerinatantimonas sp. MCCC 1A17872 TaxID=3177514 RepID=UPI0038C7BDC9
MHSRSKNSAYFSRMPRPVGWALLVGLSVLCAWLMQVVGLSAEWMVGPMVAAIVIALMGIRLNVNRPLYQFCQAIVGCVIAQSLTSEIVKEVLKDWPIVVLVVASVMVLSWGLGWILGKLKVMPAQVAIWGASPGAASAMVILAKAYGADARLVAFMQYIRVLLVVIMSSLVAAAVVPKGAMHHSLFENWAQVPNISSFALTMALIFGSMLLAKFAKIPAGAMLIPMFLGTILHVNGWLTITLPESLLAISYLVVGWVIGVGFDRQTFRASLYALPKILLMNVLLMVLCAGLALLASHWFHVDLLSAYLATSPGGANTVAIIALSNPVNVPFIMALQTSRLFAVVALGPWIAKWLGKKIQG